MVVVEELLFSEVEHKIEFFPFRIHWTLLSCEHREREREREESIAIIRVVVQHVYTWSIASSNPKQASGH